MPRRARRVKRILKCIPSRDTEKDWGFENAVEADVLTAVGPLPKQVDLRESWWRIGDQKRTGSCVGWATADSLLRWHFVKAERLSKNDLLSVRFIWMAAKEMDEFVATATTFIEAEGTSLKAALDVARKYGAVLDPVLPFARARLYQGDQKTFYAFAAKLKIAAYFNLGTNLANWRTWLATRGPILTRLSVDATWDNATDTQGNLDAYLPATARGGHAIALVGYTDDRFIVRNSWGTDWGDKGFGYASMAYAQDAFTEAYGISVL